MKRRDFDNSVGMCPCTDAYKASGPHLHSFSGHASAAGYDELSTTKMYCINIVFTGIMYMLFGSHALIENNLYKACMPSVQLQLRSRIVSIQHDHMQSRLFASICGL